MKKLLYVFMLFLVASLSLCSCTEETVKPNNIAGSGSGIKE